ncbi:hypothetical protein LEUCIP111803_02070 [Leucobacter soli]|uniref:Acyltransferase n=2 Tax=Leucobacter soli TaxID=2812850 RepID=A0A916NP48_9MICO|nr:hypothetical protein LEUCIP111803_02070 [Leucobacter soli]
MPAYLNGVQGLRTVAALMVAVYHIWFGRVSGAVDVFFVVAGYFAAKSLMRMAESETFRARVQVMSRYWMRTLRRITPSAVVVIIGTAVASLLFMPHSAWQYAIPHGFASLFHFENWLLIASNADYLQDGMAASPFQQFWALSLQAQFYLLFPLLLFVAVSLAKRRGWGARGTTLAVLALTFAASFAFAIWFTAVDQPAAYFHSLARGWEFMAGAILFLLMTRGLAQKGLAAAMGWVGLIALIGLGATMDVSALFPGWAALIPVTAAILIMISAASRRAPILLSVGPLVWFGNASFAFYLWHWPILVLYRHRFGEQVGLKGGLAILALSAVLAYATTRFVETPVRDWKRIQGSAAATLVATVLMMAPAFAALSYWDQALEREQERAVVLKQAAIDGDEIPDDEIVPAPALARDDVPDFYSMRCHQQYDDPEVKSCVLGDEDGDVTIAVVGGSHSGQWMDLVLRTAQEVGAKVTPYIKLRCGFADMELMPEVRDPSCIPWSAEVLQRLIDDRPDLVVVLATLQDDGRDEVPEGYAAYFEELAEHGIPMVGIRDNPRFDFDVPDCVERDGADACALPRSDFYEDDAEFDFSDFGDFTFVDIARDACPEATCEAVQGNVLVYRDKHHFTNTWVLRNGGAVADAITGWFAQGRR